MSTYTVNHILDEKKRILVREFAGSVIMEDVIDAWKQDISSGIVNTQLKGVVTDFTNCKNNATMSELSQISDFYKSHFDIFRHFKHGVVLDSPGVAILLMFENNYADIKHKAFCTNEAAMEWVSH
ncbi:hypothetical protein [Labilibacter marinus]|uniref:hypothetical protein n=1 Tax=Labilibacter marinus TaxID=1477105 RepID=UPI00094FE96E|nr:hypothetical protein [Labilibacter marinus]